MKILIISDGHGGKTHGDAFKKSFEELGHEVSVFTWQGYFKNYPYADCYETDSNFLKSIYYRFQNKFTFGPALLKLNSDAVKKCNEIKPDLVFVYRGTHIFPSTVKKMQKTSAKVFGYNNDDPFSEKYASYVWRHFKKCIPFYDHVFYYRQKNKTDYDALGCKNSSLLRSYYIKENNFQIPSIETNKYTCDAIFIGHFEEDGRDDALKLLLDNGINLKLYGTNWEKSKHYAYFVEKLGNITPLYDDYNLALNSAKIALVFLSKLNNDSYTRRCFEIPATGTLMLAEDSDDLSNNLFEEDKEAIYFKTPEELLTKVQAYSADTAKRKKIATSGKNKLEKSGHEVLDRAKQVLEIFKG